MNTSDKIKNVGRGGGGAWTGCGFGNGTDHWRLAGRAALL
jgi:hypothetical protein